MKRRNNMRLKINNNSAITLIALVITIVVLLILAGVTIAALSGDNGILTRAKEAKEKTEQAQKEEEVTLSNMEDMLDNVEFKNINTQDTKPGKVLPTNVTILENDGNKGIVIKDQNNNEWVWIEVPKTTVFAGLTIDTTKELTEQNYNDIRDKLIAYAITYREGKAGQGRYWTDEWYEGCSLTSDEYTATYQKMLKSVYNYGGFWIGRYESGIEGSIDDVLKARISHTTVTIDTSPKAISQKDAIPYNYVYCNEAQALAKEMTPNSDYTSSLLFGIQWDLVCRFLEIKGGLKTTDINSESGAWGNYYDVERTINSKKAKQGDSWITITGKKVANSLILLTTGASEETNKMNIYDFAGNELEWTLEHDTSDSSYPCSSRGGNYGTSGSYGPASGRYGYDTTFNTCSVGFRSTLYAN